MAQLPPITVFDIETTGLDPARGHRMIEIAGVRIENGVILEEQSFVSFVNPERDIPLEARQVNKISDDDVKSAPLIDEVLPKFLEFAKGTLLFAHNAEFDYGFLMNEKQFCWGYIDLPECFCTMRLSQSIYPTEFRHNLDVLVKKFGLTVEGDRHRALADTVVTAQALLKLLEAGNINSLDELKKKAALKRFVTK
jgi:DNA polymerase III epsilon subunit family exonuclease